MMQVCRAPADTLRTRVAVQRLRSPTSPAHDAPSGIRHARHAPEEPPSSHDSPGCRTPSPQPTGRTARVAGLDLAVGVAAITCVAITVVTGLAHLDPSVAAARAAAGSAGAHRARARRRSERCTRRRRPGCRRHSPRPCRSRRRRSRAARTSPSAGCSDDRSCTPRRPCTRTPARRGRSPCTPVSPARTEPTPGLLPHAGASAATLARTRARPELTRSPARPSLPVRGHPVALARAGLRCPRCRASFASRSCRRRAHRGPRPRGTCGPCCWASPRAPASRPRPAPTPAALQGPPPSSTTRLAPPGCTRSRLPSPPPAWRGPTPPPTHRCPAAASAPTPAASSPPPPTARAALIRALSGEAAGTLAGLEAVSAWLDRPAGVVHVLVAAPTPAARPRSPRRARVDHRRARQRRGRPHHHRRARALRGGWRVQGPPPPGRLPVLRSGRRDVPRPRALRHADPSPLRVRRSAAPACRTSPARVVAASAAAPRVPATSSAAARARPAATDVATDTARATGHAGRTHGANPPLLRLPLALRVHLRGV